MMEEQTLFFSSVRFTSGHHHTKSLNGHQEVHPIDWEEEKESLREEWNSFIMRAEEPEAEILQLLRTLETILQPNLQEEFLWDSLMYISKWLNGHFVWL